MTYKGEDLVRRLKQARTNQNMSQRALAERSGLTQGHISQIESGATEPGLSSLIDLARALDLEVMLVPKKRIPAVSSLIETSAPAGSQPDPSLRREIERGMALVEAIADRIGSTAGLDAIREALLFLRTTPMTSAERQTVLDVLDGLRRRQEHPEVGRRAREAAETLQALRNRLAHPRPTAVRAAYALDDEDDVDG